MEIPLMEMAGSVIRLSPLQGERMKVRGCGLNPHPPFSLAKGEATRMHAMQISLNQIRA